MDHRFKQLIDQAQIARQRAYAPYSNFLVGCALLKEDGNIQLGCNIENGAFTPSNCAERTALFAAIADGQAPQSFQALAVVADTEQPVTPCGVCRQVLVELCAPDMPIILANMKGDYTVTTIAELLPGAFALR